MRVDAMMLQTFSDVKIAKKLKKEKVNIDIISFGEDECNNEKLATFINTLNGADGSRYYYC